MSLEWWINYRQIEDESDIARLVSLSAKTAASADWVTGLLERGEGTRPRRLRRVRKPVRLPLAGRGLLTAF